MQLPYSRTRGKRGFSDAASSIGEMGRWESKALEDGMKRRRLPAWMGAGASSKQGKPRKNHHGFLIRALWVTRHQCHHIIWIYDIRIGYLLYNSLLAVATGFPLFQSVFASLCFGGTPWCHCYYHCHNQDQIHPPHIDWDSDYSSSTLQHHLSALQSALYIAMRCYKSAAGWLFHSVQCHSVSTMQPNYQCNSCNKQSSKNNVIILIASKAFQSGRDHRRRRLCLLRVEEAEWKFPPLHTLPASSCLSRVPDHLTDCLQSSSMGPIAAGELPGFRNWKLGSFFVG